MSLIIDPLKAAARAAASNKETLAKKAKTSGAFKSDKLAATEAKESPGQQTPGEFFSKAFENLNKEFGTDPKKDSTLSRLAASFGAGGSIALTETLNGSPVEGAIDMLHHWQKNGLASGDKGTHMTTSADSVDDLKKLYLRNKTSLKSKAFATDPNKKAKNSGEQLLGLLAASGAVDKTLDGAQALVGKPETEAAKPPIKVARPATEKENSLHH